MKGRRSTKDPRPGGSLSTGFLTRAAQRHGRRTPDLGIRTSSRLVLTPVSASSSSAAPAASPSEKHPRNRARVIFAAETTSPSWTHFLSVAMFNATARVPAFMAKSQLLHAAGAVHLPAMAGCFPVRRGPPTDEEAFITANTVPRGGAGASSCIARAGARRTGQPGPSRPRRGIGRLALETGAPIVPIAIPPAPRRPANWKRPAVSRR